MSKPCCGRETTFLNFFKILKTIIAIPVTNCTCERMFPKLKFMRTKIRCTMTQECLDGLLEMFIDQELANNINVEEVIDQFYLFKILTPKERRMEL